MSRDLFSPLLRPRSPGGYLASLFAVLVVALSVVWIYVWAEPLAFMPSGYPSWVVKKEILHECRAATIDFFGNSRIEAGIVPTALPVTANNIGVAAGTPVEVESGVRRALNCTEKPRLVVIALDESSFGPLSRFFWLESLDYHFLSFSDLWELEQSATALGDLDTLRQTKTPEGLSGPVRDWLYALRFPSLSFSNLAQGQIFGRYRGNVVRLEQIRRARGFVPYPTLPPTNRPGPEAQLSGFVTTKLQIVYFERTLTALRDHGVPVALLLMPMKKVTKDATPPGVEAKYVNYLRSLSARYRNVQLVNDEFPSWPSKMFSDEIHLNLEGAQRFTDSLGNCIEGASIRVRCNLAWDVRWSQAHNDVGVR